jgi:hypothetical protein
LPCPKSRSSSSLLAVAAALVRIASGSFLPGGRGHGASVCSAGRDEARVP